MKNRYTKRERERCIGIFFVYQSLFGLVENQFEEYQIFFGFGFRLCPWQIRVKFENEIFHGNGKLMR